MARRERLICASPALVDGGPGVRFPGEPGRGETGFAIRHRGVACATSNRCPHAGTELDWQPGGFFEESGLYLICSTTVRFSSRKTDSAWRARAAAHPFSHSNRGA
jgi:nitrite reductase/ring-hydroxylating ferredoxin subunit